MQLVTSENNLNEKELLYNTSG